MGYLFRRIKWRIGNIWYNFTCWAWHRYTIVKPRWLAHTYTDTCDLIPHTMFELLCQFIEDEKPFDRHDWGWCKEHADAKAELMRLYLWWNTTYIPFYRDENPEMQKCYNIVGKSAINSQTLGEEERQALGKIIAMEDQMEKDLASNMCSLSRLCPYMWT